MKKIDQETFLFTFLFLFFMAFLAQKLIYTINIWFKFAIGFFFEHDHLLKLIIVGVYAKRWPKCARISKQIDVAQNLINDFFSNFDCKSGSSNWCNWWFFTAYLFCACGWESSEEPIKVFSLWIFLRGYFLTILIIMVTEQLYWRKILSGCFRFI